MKKVSIFQGIVGFSALILLHFWLIVDHAESPEYRRPIDKPEPTSERTLLPAPEPFITETSTHLPEHSQLNLKGDTTIDLSSIPNGFLKKELRQLSNASKRKALDTIQKLNIPEHDLANSVHASAGGFLYYVCVDGQHEEQHEHSSEEMMHPSHPIDDSLEFEQLGFDYPNRDDSLETPVWHLPIYHSRPESSRKIFLDFNGHVVKDTLWNETFEVEEFNCGPAFDPYSRPKKTFNEQELGSIQRIWMGVAQHFSTFDVDVTTEEPEVMDKHTIHVLITPEKDLNQVYNPRAEEASGVAFLDVFGESDFAYRSPVFVYTEGSSAGSIAGIAAHEVGHYLSLSHDGDSSEEYYPGHSINGSYESWRTIMGSARGGRVIQWSKGDYFDANNKEDDIQIISNRLPFLPDDVTDSRTSAQQAPTYGDSFYKEASIASANDEDWYWIELGNDGRVILKLKPQHNSYVGNAPVDLSVEIYDSNGSLVATETQLQIGDCYIDKGGLAPGKYYIKVFAQTWGEPTANPAIGYTAYGNRGRYVLNGLVWPSNNNLVHYLQHPEPVTAVCGTTATFDILLPNYNQQQSFRWQVSTDNGATWEPYIERFHSQNDHSLSVHAVTPDMDGYLFRCQIYQGADLITSDSARLTVITEDGSFPITHQPEDQSVLLPDETTVTLSFGVEHIDNEAIQHIWWELQYPGEDEWRRLYNGRTDELTVYDIQQAFNGFRYRCRVLNYKGDFYSDVVTLSVRSIPHFSPVFPHYDITPGSPAIFKTEFVTGYPEEFTFQWEYKRENDASWTQVTDNSVYSGSTTEILNISGLPVDFDQSEWRMVIENSAGIGHSDSITVSMDPQSATPALAKSSMDYYTGIYLRTDGSLWGSGINNKNQIGEKRYYQELYPILIEAEGVIDCANSFSHTIFLKEDGTLWGLGSNESYRLGLEDYGVEVSTPVRIAPEFDDIIACAANDYQTVFLRADHTLWAIGRYIEFDDSTPSRIPVKIGDGIIACEEDYHVHSSGRIYQHSEPPYFHYRYASETPNVSKFIEGNRQRFTLTIDGELFVESNTGKVTQVATDIVDIERSQSGYYLWILKSDQSLWHYDPEDDEFTHWADNVQRLFDCNEAALFLDNDNWLWGIGRGDDGLLGTGGVPSGDYQIVPVEARTDFTPPTNPANLLVSSTEEFHLISWSRSLGTFGFNVWRGPSENFEEAELVAEALEQTYWFDTDANINDHPSVTFHYWVESMNKAGTSSRIGPLAASQIELPAELKAYMYGENIDLSWSPAAKAESYTIWRSTSGDVENAVVVKKGIQETNWTDEDTDVENPPFYWVQAVNSKATSGKVGRVQSEFLQAPVLEYMRLEPQYIDIDWHKPQGAYMVDVFKGPTPNFEDAEFIDEVRWGNGSNYFFEDLNPMPFFWLQARYYDGGASKVVPVSMSIMLGPDGIKDYSTFKERYFPESKRNDPAYSDPESDPDGDKRTNFEEFVFYGDPMDPNDSIPAPLRPFYYKKNKPPPLPFRPGLKNVRYYIQVSSDLKTWGPHEYPNTAFRLERDTNTMVYLLKAYDNMEFPTYVRVIAEPVGPLD